MNKDELIRKLLAKLNAEDLAEILDEDEEDIEQLEEVVAEQQNPSEFHSIKNKNRKRSKKVKTPKGKKQKEDKGDVCRKEQMKIGSRPNEFDIIMKNAVLSADEKKELEAVEKIKIPPVTNKQKRPSTLVNVTCRCCHDEYEVSAAMVGNPKRWKCNTCSAGAF